MALGAVTQKLRLVIDGDSHGATTALRRLDAQLGTTNRQAGRTSGAFGGMSGATATWRGRMQAARGSLSSLAHGDLPAARAGFATATGGLGNLAAAAGIAAGAIAAIGLAMKKTIDAYTSFGKEMLSLQRYTGLAGNASLELYAQLRMMGMDMNKVAPGFQIFNKNLDKARRGVELSLEPFKRLGVAVRDDNGQLRPMAKVLGDVRDRIAETEDPTTRTAIAVGLFGRSARNLLPWLTKNREELEKYNRIIGESGLTWGGRDVKNYKKFLESQREMNLRWDIMKIQVGQGLAPAMRTINAIVLNTNRLLSMTNVTLGDVALMLAPILGPVNLLRLGWENIVILAERFDTILKGGAVNWKGALGGLFGGPVGYLVGGAFASGGVATRPTLAVVGERETEWMVPQSKAGAFARSVIAAQGGGRGGLHLHFHGPVVGGRAGMRELGDILDRQLGNAYVMAG